MNLIDQSYKEQAEETWVSWSDMRNSSRFISYFCNPNVCSLDIPQSSSLLVTSLCHCLETAFSPLPHRVGRPVVLPRFRRSSRAWHDHGLISLQLPTMLLLFSVHGDSSRVHISFSFVLIPHSTTYTWLLQVAILLKHNSREGVVHYSLTNN